MKCIFCEKESTNFKKVPNRNRFVYLCKEHYNTKTSGEIYEEYVKQNEKPKFICQVCNKEFKSRIALLGHSRGHKEK